MERAEENYLRLPFTAQCLPAVENPSRDKVQMGFIMTQEELNSPWCPNFHQATSTWFSRKMSLWRPQLDKAKNKGQTCPCLHCSTNPRISLGIHWFPSRHQHFSAHDVFHTQVMLCLIVKADVPQRRPWVPTGFVPSGKAEADVLVVLQVFHTLPPAMPYHPHLGEKLEISSNILQMFSLPLHNFI